MKAKTLLPPPSRNINLLFTGAGLHAHKDWELTLFTSGTCKNIINGTEYMLSEGFLTILGAPHKHEIISPSPSHAHRDIYITDKKLHHLCMELFSENFYQLLCDSQNPIVLQLSKTLTQKLEQQLALLDAAYIQHNDAAINPIISSIIVYLLGQVYMQNKISLDAPTSWLSNQLVYLQRPNVFSLDTEDIIKPTGYSHSQYLRKFKRASGVPLVKYLVKLRINHAKFLLQTTSKSVLEIASDVGYDSINYFIRAFKAHTGTTPLQFRLKSKL